METNQFKTGDAVRLKSGSRTMRINYMVSPGNYNCIWHDGLAIKEEEFSYLFLEIIESNAIKTTEG